MSTTEYVEADVWVTRVSLDEYDVRGMLVLGEQTCGTRFRARTTCNLCADDRRPRLPTLSDPYPTEDSI